MLVALLALAALRAARPARSFAGAAGVAGYRVGTIRAATTATSTAGDADREALTAAARAGDWREALHRLDGLCAAAEASERWPHPRCFDDAVLACSRAQPSRWEEALNVLQRMRTFRLEPGLYAYNNALWACARANEWREAMKLLGQMKRSPHPPDVVSFTAVLSAARAGGEWQLALNLLTQMKDRGLTPNAMAYGMAIGACRRGGRGTEAAKLVRQMQAEGIDPPELTLCEALTACAREGAHGDAANLWAALEEMEAQAGGLDMRAYWARLQERGTARDWRGALALLDHISGDRTSGAVDESCLNMAARACGLAGAWEAAAELLQTSEASYGIAPTERMRRSTIQAAGVAKRPDMALLQLDEAEVTAAPSNPLLAGLLNEPRAGR